MDRFARAFISVVWLAAAGLGFGCGNTSQGTFSPEKFWEKNLSEQPGGGG